MNRLALALLFCLLLSIPAPAQGPLDNPDGYYAVTKNGIERLTVEKRDKAGNCMYLGYIVQSTMKNMPAGQLSSRGWWAPSTQQFLDQTYMNFPSRPRCNGWWKPSWSHQYVWDDGITFDGVNMFPGYKKVKTAPADRQPEPRCTRVRIEKNSCDAYCIETNNEFTPCYLVRSKKDALAIYRRLR